MSGDDTIIDTRQDRLEDEVSLYRLDCESENENEQAAVDEQEFLKEMWCTLYQHHGIVLQINDNDGGRKGDDECDSDRKSKSNRVYRSAAFEDAVNGKKV